MGWQMERPLPGPNALLVPVTLSPESFMLVGGFNGTSGADMSPKDLLSDILKLNRPHGQSGTLQWEKVAKLPQARGFPAAVIANGSLFVVGGYNAETRIDSPLVEALDLSSMTWSSCVDENHGQSQAFV